MVRDHSAISDHVLARPLSGLVRRAERPNVSFGDATESLAATGVTVRCDIVTRDCNGGASRLTMPGVQERDQGIVVVAVDGAPAPRSHDLYMA